MRRLKIAFIVSEFPVVSETFILSQITGLLDRGHAVDIYAKRQGPQPVIHQEVERYRLRERTRYMKDFSLVKGRLRRLKRAAVILTKHAVRHPAWVRRWMGAVRSCRPYEALDLLFKLAPFWDADYDIIHAHFGPNGNQWSFLKELTRAKVVCSFYGYDVSSYLQEHGNDVYRELFARGDLFVAMSDHMRARVEALGCDRSRLAVQRLGIDTSRFIPVNRPNAPGRPVQILTVARLVEKKGHAFALQAIAQVVQTHSNIMYQIAGEGPLVCQLQSLIRELALERHVSLLGAQHNEAVARLMTEVDIFLLPSVTAASGDQEGIPVSLAEAQASGLPVVATRHSGISELVEEGRSGFLVPERDAAALADRLRFLIEHPEVRRQFGAHGRQLVEAHYNITKLNGRLERLYQAVLNGVEPVLCCEEREAEDADALSPDISIILATRNRAESLRDTLAALARQETGGTFTYEVLVVDNGSTDSTRRVVETLQPAFPAPLRYLYEPRPGKPFALNTGLPQARGQVFAFLDDDIVPSPTWLASLRTCFVEEAADGVAGRIIPDWVDGRPEWLTDDVMRALGTLGCLDFGPARTVMTDDGWWVGGNMAFRRELAARLGGYDVRRLRGQDVELFHRFIQAGVKIVYEPSAVARHRIGAYRLTPAHFRRWHERSGYYRAYSWPWKPKHLVTLMPLYAYRDLLRCLSRWWLMRREGEQRWLRFAYECKARALWQALVHRLQLWPQGCLTVLKRAQSGGR